MIETIIRETPSQIRKHNLTLRTNEANHS